jgi:hypothetical protein
MAARSGRPLGQWRVGQGMVVVFPHRRGPAAPWHGWRPPSSSTVDPRHGGRGPTILVASSAAARP